MPLGRRRRRGKEKQVFPRHFLVLLPLLAFLCGRVRLAHAKPTKYTLELSDSSPCVRLFYNTGDVGCRTPASGGVELVLYAVTSEAELAALEETSGEEVAAILPSAYFNATIVDRLEASGRLGAIMVLDDSDAPPSTNSGGTTTSSATTTSFAAAAVDYKFSPDATTPQGDTTPSFSLGVDPSHEWNTRGNGLMLRSFDYPIVLISKGSDSEELLAGGEHNAKMGSATFPRYAAKFDYYFGQEDDVTSIDCLEWTDINGVASPKCTPLGGQSVWGVAGVPGDKEVVLVAAQLDSSGLFHDAVPGGNGVVSALAAMLLAAEAIARAATEGTVDLSGLGHQLGFAAFQGEEWGFIGSRSFVADALSSEFDCDNPVDAETSPSGLAMCLDPLHPSLQFRELSTRGMAHVLTVDQVGRLEASGSDGNNNLYWHSSAGASVTDLNTLNDLTSASAQEGVTIDTASTAGVLPPTPLSSFAAADTAQSGFVLAGYDDAFVDDAYHSHWDVADERCEVSNVVAAGLALAQGSLTLAVGSGSLGTSDLNTLSVNETLAEQLVDCLSNDWACDLMEGYVATELANMETYRGAEVSMSWQIPPTFYTSVLQYWGSFGYPTLRHSFGGSSWQLYAAYTEDFDPDVDTLMLTPSRLETFVRTFLAEQLAKIAEAATPGESFAVGACDSTPDCDGALCPQVGSFALMECVAGVCVCPFAFYHLAMDPGLERLADPTGFRVVDAEAPLWTEPIWDTIGVSVYKQSSDAVGAVAVSVGVVLLVLGAAAATLTRRRLQKDKLI